jgi:ATP-binding cassette subfamily B protein
MALRNGFGGGGMGEGALRNQQRSLRYLREGGPGNIRSALGRVWVTMRPYRLHLIIGTLIMLIGVGLGLLPPLLIRSLIDTALPQRNMHMVLLLGAGLLLLPLGSALLVLGQNYLSVLVAQGVIADLRMQLYKHIQSLGLEFFTWTRAGEIQTRFFNDAGSLQNVLTQSFLGTIANFMTLIGTLIIMFLIDWKLAIAAALALPAFALPVLHFGRKRYEAVERSQKALGELSVVLEETLSLSGALVIKSFGTEKREAQRFAGKNEVARHEQVHQQLVGQWLTVVVQGLAALGPAVLYTYGAYLVIMHQMALGTIVAFATYLVQLYSPASSLAGSQMTLLGGLAIFARLFQVLDLPVSVPEPAEPRPLAVAQPAGITFEQVHFQYPTTTFQSSARAKEELHEGVQHKKPEILHDISFKAPLGQLTALVGPSGAGKSTILSLAARFYDPSQGAVCLNGVPLSAIAGEQLREQVAVVTQEVFLFHASLRENICYGVPDATPEQVDAVVDAAQLRDVLAYLPSGLDTMVGERGYRLSGGEKQRVAIARALLRQAPYLLLDEATSSLDSQAEQKIQRALSELIQGRTVIAIAHRLSTIQRANQILVVEHGQIVERGTHEELLRYSGLYQRLYEAQFAAAQA